MATLDVSPVILMASADADVGRATALRKRGVEIVILNGPTRERRIEAALTDLGRRGITSLFLEGGRTLAAAFTDADQVDEARIFVAPLLLGRVERRAALDPGAGDTLIETRFKEW